MISVRMLQLDLQIFLRSLHDASRSEKLILHPSVNRNIVRIRVVSLLLKADLLK